MKLTSVWTRRSGKRWVNYLTTSPIKRRGKILWIRARPEILEQLAREGWEKSPAFVVLALPSEAEARGELLTGPDDVLDRLLKSLGSFASEVSAIPPGRGVRIHDDYGKYEVECPFCSTKAAYLAPLGSGGCLPAECPGCGAEVSYRSTDDVKALLHEFLQPEEVEESGNQGEGTLRIHAEGGGKEVWILQIWHDPEEWRDGFLIFLLRGDGGGDGIRDKRSKEGGGSSPDWS